MTKSEAVERLFNEYTDAYGRTTLYPAKDSDPENGIYDSENQGLWTGEAGILLRLNYESMIKYDSNYGKMLRSVYVGDVGLYSRHPAPFWQNDHHNVSKDEYRGFAYGAAAVGWQVVMIDIISYGESNSWFFVDDDPHGGFNKDHLGAFRLPTDRALYKIVAGQKPSIVELLFLGGSALLNSRKPAGDTSSKIMSWFAFKSAEIVGFESKILNFFKKRFDKNLKKCYNTDNYMEEVFKIYFPEDHPFQVLIKGLK